MADISDIAKLNSVELNSNELFDDDDIDELLDGDEESEVGLGPLRPFASADEAQLQAWLAAVVRQDEVAFESLYRSCLGRIYGMALRIVRNPAIAEEVTEETFWQIWRQAPRFEAERGTALAWMLTVARSRALDALRGQKRIAVNTVSAELVGDAIDGQGGNYEMRQDMGQGANDPHDLLEATQRHQQLHQALAKLDPLPRQLVALAFFKGLTHEEIVGETGLPLGTVKSHIRRAMVVMRKYLTPQAALI